MSLGDIDIGALLVSSCFLWGGDRNIPGVSGSGHSPIVTFTDSEQLYPDWIHSMILNWLMIIIFIFLKLVPLIYVFAKFNFWVCICIAECGALEWSSCCQSPVNTKISQTTFLIDFSCPEHIIKCFDYLTLSNLQILSILCSWFFQHENGNEYLFCL